MKFRVLAGVACVGLLLATTACGSNMSNSAYRVNRAYDGNVRHSVARDGNRYDGTRNTARHGVNESTGRTAANRMGNAAYKVNNTRGGINTGNTTGRYDNFNINPNSGHARNIHNHIGRHTKDAHAQNPHHNTNNNQQGLVNTIHHEAQKGAKNLQNNLNNLQHNANNNATRHDGAVNNNQAKAMNISQNVNNQQKNNQKPISGTNGRNILDGIGNTAAKIANNNHSARDGHPVGGGTIGNIATNNAGTNTDNNTNTGTNPNPNTNINIPRSTQSPGKTSTR